MERTVETSRVAREDVDRTKAGHAPLERRIVEGLRARFGARLLLSGEAGFDDAIRLWNGMVQTSPALVVQPENAEEVAAVVRLAREEGLRLSVKGGGHNIAGTALVEGGLTLDMARMRGVQVDVSSRVARVGPGCLLQDVDRATQAHGLATVLGFVSDTGVAGLTLGGGLGYLTRRFGWTVDNLQEVEVVTADGRIRRVNAQQDEDLFWALRGGGGNFGVVTQFVYRLHEVGPEITGGILAWPARTPAETEAVLLAYRLLTKVSPRELTVFCSLRRAPPAPFVPESWHGQRVALFLVCHSGDPRRAAGDLAPLRSALGEPIVDLVGRRPYVEQQSLLDESEPAGMHYYWKTEFLARLDDELLQTVRHLSQENPAPMAEIGFLHIGGALNDRPADDGAVGNRDARFAIGVNAMWAPGDPHAEAYRAWVRDAWRRIRPSSVGNYVNFQTADDGEDRLRATYGDNWRRLVEVKRRYDPDNLFRANRNIAPTAVPDGTAVR